MNLSLEVALDSLTPIIQWYLILIYASSVFSIILCILLSYIVYRFTPTSMHSRKICLLNLLVGCIILSLFYILSQPMPILPFRIVMFSGPLRSLGSTVAAILYALWFSDMTFIGNGCLVASLSHYLDLTTGLSSQNRMFRYLRRITLRKRMIVFNCYHIQNAVVSLVTIALIYIDFDYEPDRESLKHKLIDEYAMIQLQNHSYTGLLVTLSFTAWLLSYAGGIIYLNLSISKQLRELKSTISTKTFSLLSSMSRIFFSIVLAPLIFFFLPHCIFNVCNFQLPQMVGTTEWRIFVTISVSGLYGLFPYSIYLFFLIGFKQYRSELIYLLTFHRFASKNSPSGIIYQHPYSFNPQLTNLRMDPMEIDIEWTFKNLIFLNIHTYLQSVLGVISFFIAIVFFYVVVKWTPDEMVMRRTNVLIQLSACLVHWVVFSLAQTVPLFPHKSLLSTSQVSGRDLFPSNFLFVLWFVNVTFMTNSALSSSISHFLGKMEGMRQSNRLLNAYAGLSFRTKSIFSALTYLSFFSLAWQYSFHLA